MLADELAEAVADDAAAEAVAVYGLRRNLLRLATGGATLTLGFQVCA